METPGIICVTRIGGTAGDGEPRHRPHGGQGLTSEPQAVDGEQIIAGELGGGVAGHR